MYSKNKWFSWQSTHFTTGDVVVEQLFTKIEYPHMEKIRKILKTEVCLGSFKLKRWFYLKSVKGADRKMARTGKDKNQSPGRTPDPKGRKILGRKLMQNEKNAEKEETAAPPAREDRESSPGKCSSHVFTKFSSIFTNYFFVELTVITEVF